VPQTYGCTPIDDMALDLWRTSAECRGLTCWSYCRETISSAVTDGLSEIFQCHVLKRIKYR